ncbi:MAG: 4Fe-4S dicluster domain-containing protein [Negativicutes bacterium]|nr:4Fe-4S dicluster domain-containing protein [Negativicutes bacterium]
MPHYSMVIDAGKCVGCFACLVACQNQNTLPVKSAFIRFEDAERGQYPNVSYIIAPFQCQHCADAPCVEACPTTASDKDKFGLTQVDETKCIGCRRCVAACPYQARIYVASEGVAKGCNLCLSLVAEGQEPACVSTCLTRARIFGDLDAPKGDFAKALAGAKPLHPEYDTKPTLRYIIPGGRVNHGSK